jgi:hypothetical protein
LRVNVLGGIDMFQLFDDNSSLSPRTYSVKSYKKKRKLGIGKILLYFLYVVIAFIILGFTVLSAYNAI